MTPAARLSAAIAILDDWAAELAAKGESAMTLSARLAQWARQNRYAGARDRAAIADHVHDVIRRRRSLGVLWRGATGAPTAGDNGVPARGLMLALLASDGAASDEIAALFSGEGYAPGPLSAEEHAVLAACADPARRAALLDEATPAARSDWPDWLWPALAASSRTPEEEACALARRGAFDVRVNRLRSSVSEAISALADDELAAEPAPIAPTALRVAENRRLGGTDAFRGGLIEPQDAASQATALLAAHALGEAGVPGPVIDFCAGGGGKSLALAGETMPEAPLSGRRLVAHDVEPRRMEPMAERLLRAGAVVERVGPSVIDQFRDIGALVFVDAPCSGSGAWARETEAKWRLTPARLEVHGRAQREALAAGALLVRPGGVLAYVTCSILRQENHDVARWFGGSHLSFEPLPLAPAWAEAALAGPAPEDHERQFSPHADGTGGFYIALWRRKDAS